MPYFPLDWDSSSVALSIDILADLPLGEKILHLTSLFLGMLLSPILSE
jgi:hypothetical protein